MDLARLFGALAAHVLGVLLNVLAEAGHELADLLWVDLRRRCLWGGGQFRAALLLRHRRLHRRRHDALADAVLAAQRTFQRAVDKLRVVRRARLEPAIELVAAGADETI